MKITSLELSEKLKEKGFPQDNHFVYRHWRSSGEVIIDEVKEKYYDYPKSRNMPPSSEVICSAPSADEILEQLPNYIRNPRTGNLDGLWFCKNSHTEDFIGEYHTTFDAPFIELRDKSLADLMASLWLLLKEKNLLDIKR